MLAVPGRATMGDDHKLRLMNASYSIQALDHMGKTICKLRMAVSKHSHDSKSAMLAGAAVSAPKIDKPLTDADVELLESLAAIPNPSGAVAVSIMQDLGGFKRLLRLLRRRGGQEAHLLHICTVLKGAAPLQSSRLKSFLVTTLRTLLQTLVIESERQGTPVGSLGQAVLQVLEIAYRIRP